MDKKIYLFSGTHRDREWYQTYQGFRLKCVDDINRMLDYLENNEEFGVFHLDGQTVILEDYAEVMPENVLRLIKLIESGRILVGPWFTMPDEYTVSGEALIRNMLLGHKLAKKWGAPECWKVGYICDIFGHTAQMPQIFSLFGIDTAVLGRGTNDCTSAVVFDWQAPGGKKCTVYRLPEAWGYGSFFHEVLKDDSGGTISDSDPRFEHRVKVYIDREIARNNSSVITLFDAADHAPLHEDTPAYIRKIKELYPDYEVRHVNLEEMFDDLKGGKYQTKTGELNEPTKAEAAYCHLITNTLSSRYSIKRANDISEYLLAFFAEPLAALFGKDVDDYAERYIDIAWRWLLENHAHDSICGCSVDRVHNEMAYRFSQVEAIAEALWDKSVRAVCENTYVISPQGGYINIFNPLPYGGKRALTLKIPFDVNFPEYHEPFGYENIRAFRLYDMSGEEIEYAITEISDNVSVRTLGESMLPACEYTVKIAAELKPLGIISLKVVPQSAPVRFYGNIAEPEGALDNGILRIEANACGITLSDKRSGAVYSDFIKLIDDGEIGDGWFSVRPKVSRTTCFKVVSVETIYPNLVYSALRVRMSAEIPESLIKTERGYRESDKKITVMAELTFSLYKDSDKISLDIDYDNCARDHRLRIGFQTGICGGYFANEAFCFVERSCGLDKKKSAWKESDCIEKAFDGIIGKYDGERGIAVISDYGLKECGGEENGALYITLLRCFSRTHTTNGEPGGQEQGRKKYGFAIVPFGGKPDYAELQREQDIMRAAVKSYVAPRSQDKSFFEVKGANVSCVKKSEEGIIVRIYNPNKEPCEAEICGFGGKICETDVFGKNKKLARKKILLGAGEIKTLLLAT